MTELTTLEVSQSVIEAQAAQQQEVLIEKMMSGITGLVTHFTIYLGDRLGYYEILARHDHLNSLELAALTGTHERYTREWLEQQAMYGILEVMDAQADALERRYVLPLGHAEVLTDRDSLNYLTPLSLAAVGAVRPIDRLLSAFRSGHGVPFEAYGEDMRQGIAGMNRAMFLQELGQVWLPSIPDVHARLQQPGARVADFGCGFGWSSIGMALAYPSARIDGFDLDTPSIDQANNNAREYNVRQQVSFHVQDAADPGLSGQYDFVTAFECIHDMSDPVGALATMRRLANGTGSVLVVDERVGETFEPKGESSEIEALMYGFSILHCLPVGMAEHPSAATGTVMRPETLRQYAQQAGFRAVEILPVENYFFRLYRLIP
jgi:2-polyprenyl-3-methyl-5-hydroxy-6-metoxy-1,4-benzoquinol methylase